MIGNNFAVGDSGLGNSTGFVGTKRDYDNAFDIVSSALANNRAPALTGCSIADIERGSGRTFDSEQKKKLREFGVN